MRDHKENMKQIGYRIKCALADSSTTQAEVANLIGVHSSTVSQWANGYSYPSMANVIDFCDLLGCSIEYILVGKGESGAKKKEPTGIKEMKDLHDRKVISDKLYYSFLEEKLEEINE